MTDKKDDEKVYGCSPVALRAMVEAHGPGGSPEHLTKAMIAMHAATLGFDRSICLRDVVELHGRWEAVPADERPTFGDFAHKELVDPDAMPESNRVSRLEFMLYLLCTEAVPEPDDQDTVSARTLKEARELLGLPHPERR